MHLTKMSATSFRLARWRGLLVLIGGIVVLVSIFQKGVGRAVLRTVGLSQPAGYTSLSFLHPQSLPEQLKSERANVGTSFAIHNVNDTTHDYRWSVFLILSGQARRVHTGSVRLASGHQAEITRSIAITCTRGLVRIVVSLESPAESIDTWLACRPRGS